MAKATSNGEILMDWSPMAALAVGLVLYLLPMISGGNQHGET